MNTLALFNTAVKVCLGLASEKYGQMPEVSIAYDLKGTSAGQASRVGGKYYLRFNKAAMAQDWDHMVNNTIPHEVAHLVTYFHKHLADPKILKGSRGYVRNPHGPRFKQICRDLGGTGDRCHTIALEPAKKKRIIRHFYSNNHGQTVQFTTTTHNKILAHFKMDPQAKVKLSSGAHVTKDGYMGAKVIR